MDDVLQELVHVLVKQVARDVVAGSSSHIDEPMPCDLMGKIGRVGEASLKLKLQCLKNELCAAFHLQVGQKQLPTMKHSFSVSLMPGICKLHH